MNKIIKHFEVALLCCLCVALVAGNSSSLKIFKNVDGSVVEVLSKLQVPSSANLTLICKSEHIKGTGLFDGFVKWFIPLKIHFEWKLLTLQNGSNLVLNNLNKNNEGLYVCGNLKFKIFKILHLLVEHNKSVKPNYINDLRLDKREILPGNGPGYDFNITNLHETPDLSKIIADLEIMREDLLRDVNIHNLQHHTTKSPLPVKVVAIIFGLLIIIFMVFAIIIRCWKYIAMSKSVNNANNRQHNTHNSEITTPRINRCGHPSCTTNNFLNPAGACRFHENTSPTVPIFDTVYIENNPQTHHTRYSTLQLDLPPILYSSSKHSSTQNLHDATYGFNKNIVNAPDNYCNSNLPPSYNEAVCVNNDHFNDSGNYNQYKDHDSRHYQTTGLWS